ncbi:unnamed protein product [Gordionus sp. m RMFG-2023]
MLSEIPLTDFAHHKFVTRSNSQFQTRRIEPRFPPETWNKSILFSEKLSVSSESDIDGEYVGDLRFSASIPL